MPLPAAAAAALPYLIPAAATAASAITSGGPRRQYKYNKKAMKLQNKMNRENQEYTLAQNKQLLAEQRMYDSASAQMQRFKDAGLNPHLIYGDMGGGSSAIQANPLPAAQMDSVNFRPADYAGDFIRASQAQSQIGLTNTKIEESIQKQGLIAAQTAVTKANPMLNPRVLEAISAGMVATADIKELDRNWMMESHAMEGRKDPERSNGMKKRDADLDQLIRKYELDEADLFIKNKVIESKEFENALKEIQTKWLKDGEITPEHIRQGLMMLLMKFK